MPKLNFDETLQHINEECPVDVDEVLASAKRRTIWLACSNFPGCLPEYRAVCATKKDAIESLLQVAEDCDGPPRGMKASLRSREAFHHNGLNYSIEKMRLGDIL